MKDYEIISTYLNGCSGAAYPITGFDEATVASPEDYIRAKHGAEAQQFLKESLPDGKTVYKFDNGTICYIYEFTEL